MECTVCGKEFEARRSTAKYCSDKCRVDASRGVSVTGDKVSVTKPEESVTVKKDSVTKNWRDELMFLGRRVGDLDQYFKLGNEVFCEVMGCRHTFHSSELPYWMLDGEAEGKVGGRIGGKILEESEKRVIFRGLMYEHDVRYVR